MKYELITSIYQLSDIEKLKQVSVDSVILGAPFFSVRSSNYLNNEELKNAVNQLHELDMNAYFLMNRFFVESELAKAKQFLLYLKELKVDGIYFTDLCIYELAKELKLESILIYNPETLLTNSQDVLAYMNLGIKRCVLAKEITLEEMMHIGERVKTNLEVVIHGRLNMMHSKRNLLTNYLDFINCDLDLRNKDDLYLMEENRDEHMPIIEDEQGTHIFTGFTLASYEEILDLYHSNIKSFKIESLFSNIDELCEIVSDYHNVLNNQQNGKEVFEKYRLNKKTENITKGFMYKKTGLLK